MIRVLKEPSPEDYTGQINALMDRGGKYPFCLENGLAATIYKSGTERVTQITKTWNVNLIRKRHAYSDYFFDRQNCIFHLQSGDYPVIEIQINREKVYLTFYKTDIAWVVWILKHHLKLAFCAEHLVAYANQVYESMSKPSETLQRAILKKVEPSLIQILFPL
jgi:hypothetical protein